MRFSLITTSLFMGLLFSACQKTVSERELFETSPCFSQDHFSIGITDIYDYVRVQKGLERTKGDEISIEPYIVDRDTVLFLVNFEDGWELLSADRRAPKTFAMSDKGHFSFSGLSDVPPLHALFDRFAQNIAILKRNPSIAISDNFNDTWDTASIRSFDDDWELESETIIAETDSIQNHLTITRWGQGSPWNCRSPYSNSSLSTHCVTGCVPVAMAQLLYYLHDNNGYPTHAYGESSTTRYIPDGVSYIVLQPQDVSFDATTYLTSTWNNMPLSSSDSGSFASVSTLMTQLGLYVSAKYYTNMTSAYTSSIAPALANYFSISSIGSSLIDYQVIADQIYSEQMPVLLTISRVGGAHAVLADACKEHYQTVRRLYKRMKPIQVGSLEFPYEYKFETSTEMTSRYLGINWGWNGAYMTSGGETVWFSTDAISWNVGYVYTSVDYMIYDFELINN